MFGLEGTIALATYQRCSPIDILRRKNSAQSFFSKQLARLLQQTMIANGFDCWFIITNFRRGRPHLLVQVPL
eukprot:2876233-Amphidinium_carterae.1